MIKDSTYLEMCNSIATNSKCLSRKIGTILVKDGVIIGTGYNGPPRGMPHCGSRWVRDEEYFNEAKKHDTWGDTVHLSTTCPRQILGFKSGEGLEWCVAGHAERNALINAAREGISTKGSIMYMNCGIPCTPCLVELINAGVYEIIIDGEGVYDLSANYVLDNCKLKVRLFDGRVLKNGN